MRKSCLISLCCLILSQPGYTDIVTEYNFDGTINDIAATGAVADNLYSVPTGEIPTFAPGVSGFAIQTGKNSNPIYASYVADHSVDLDLGGVYTIEGFIYDLSQGEEWGRLFLKWEPSHTIHVAMNGANIGFHHAQSDSFVTTDYDNPLSQNEWHHIAVVADGVNITLWLDGTAVDSIGYDGTTRSSPDTPFNLGGNINKSPAQDNSNFNGYIDEVRIHNAAVDENYIDSRVVLLTTGVSWVGSPTPSDESGSTPLDVNLSWLGDDDADSFDVYFGTASDSLTHIATVVEPTVLNENLPALTNDATYYWQVVQHISGKDDYTSPVWSFTTLPVTSLSLHWALDEGSGSTAIDSSGNGNDGSFVNSPDYVTGIMGTALAFDPNDSVKLLNAVNLPLKASESFSINVFLKSNQIPENAPLVGFGDIYNAQTRYDNGETGWMRGFLQSSNVLRSWGWGADLVTGEAFTLNQWQMLTICYDGYTGESDVYRNGYLIANDAIQLTDAEPAVWLSAALDVAEITNYEEYVGLVDDFRIYKGELSEDQIQNLLPFAHNPHPADEADEVPVDATLTWDAGLGAVTHNLYYSTEVDPNGLVNPISVTGLTEAEYTLSGLSLLTTYYWSVEEVSAANTVEAIEVWSFTTTPPRANNPIPQDGAVEAPLNQVLSWLPGGSGTYTYNVYFGVDANNLPLASAGQSELTFDPDLEYGQTYYWKIDQVNGDPSVEGVAWSFSTIVPQCDPPLLGDISGDCYVDLIDFALLASDWMKCNLVPVEACP